MAREILREAGGLTGLRDPGDDMVLELAVASQAEVIVTFNERHFVGCETFGVRVMNPGAFLEEIGETR